MFYCNGSIILFSDTKIDWDAYMSQVFTTSFLLLIIRILVKAINNIS